MVYFTNLNNHYYENNLSPNKNHLIVIKMVQKYLKNTEFFAVIAVTAIAVGNIAVIPIAVFAIPTAM